MITNIEVKTARMYANLKERTPFQEKQLLRYFLRLDGELKRSSINRYVMRIYDSDRAKFNEMLDIAINHFSQEPKHFTGGALFLISDL